MSSPSVPKSPTPVKGDGSRVRAGGGFWSGMRPAPGMTSRGRRFPDLANFLGERWEAPWLQGEGDWVSWVVR